MQAKEGVKLIGEVIIEEINPVTKKVISREVGENIICKVGADTIANALFAGAAATTFNFMILSTDNGAVLRSTTAIPATRNQSSVITPTLAITGSTSIVTWVHTFLAGTGATATWKFGMENSASGSGFLLNEYLFASAKDNWTNDLKLTYNLSVAP
jgi:hypothetical protein